MTFFLAFVLIVVATETALSMSKLPDNDWTGQDCIKAFVLLMFWIAVVAALTRAAGLGFRSMI